MALNCNNIRDYVPLYKAGALSGETVSEINEHLSSCEECKGYYEQCGAQSAEKEPREKRLTVKKVLNKKTGITAAAAVGIMAIAAGIAYLADRFTGDKK